MGSTEDAHQHHGRLWLLMGLATTLLVLSGVRQVGMGWDEPEYIHAGTSYTYWFTHGAPRLSAETIRALWTWQHIHPPLGQLLVGLCVRVFGGALGVLAAARIAPALCLGATVALLGAWCERELGERVALLAAISLVLFPRVFGSAHFAALDTPMMFIWLATVVVFQRALRSAAEGWRATWSAPALLSGLTFGLALLTKVNAVFLPLVLWPWAIVRYGTRARGPILAALVLGPVLFFLCWPWMYHETAARALAYALDKTSGRVFPVLYLGQGYSEGYAPWHYPLVLVGVTVPAGLLAAAAVGLVVVLRRRCRGGVTELSLLNFLAVVGIASLPWAPKYDGVRLFLPAFPFLAVLTGVGLAAGYRKLQALLGRRRRLGVTVAAAFLAAQCWGLIWAWPFHLTYYNMVIGGRGGAQRVGLETMYWGEAFDREAMAALEELLSETQQDGLPARISFVGMAKEVPAFLQKYGYLTERFVPVGPQVSEAHYLVVARREGSLLAEGWMGASAPRILARAVFIREHRGTALLWILRWEDVRRPE